MFKVRKREVLHFETPQEMYDDYKNRKITGIQAYQSEMLDAYMEEGLDKSDVALELPTGTGKTLIGLLIGEFRRRKYKEKVVYVCPTSQLVYQTANYANEKYGIRVVPFTGTKKDYNQSDKLDYLLANCMAITNYSSIFNVNSFFDETDVLIFDDAHSGENYISSNWTVTISRYELSEAYWALFEVIKSTLTDEQRRIILKKEPKQDDQSWCDMIHNSKLISKYNIIQEALDDKLDNSGQIFSWKNIRSHIYACNVYLSWESIVIRPYIAPTQTCPVFANAKTRIYMSATLGDCGELERAYGIEKVHKLPIVKAWKNKDIGRRFFVFPLAFMNDSQALNIMCSIAKRVNRALILVNDLKTQDGIQQIFKENYIGKTFNGKSIELSKEEFIKSDRAYAVIANRFDGIDFPEDECRVLILFDVPTISHIQEKFMITQLSARTLFKERIKTRMIQAMGRCNRSQTDYAAICVLSSDIMTYLLSPANKEKFNPELQAEIEFGYDNAKNQKDIDEYLKLLDAFIEHKADWETAEEGIISIRDDLIANSTIQKNEVYEQLNKSVKHEVRLQYALWKKDYMKALQEIDEILRNLQADEVKGYRGYWYYIGGCCAFSLYKDGGAIYERMYKEYFQKASNSSIAVNWFKYEENKKEKEQDYLEDMLFHVENFFENRGKRGLKNFYEFLDSTMRLLKSGGKDFEKGYEMLGEISGFITLNPKGSAEPDPIWIVNRHMCIVSENKIYDDGKLIPPNHVKEAAGHSEWVKEKAESLNISSEAVIITVFITTAVKAQENTTFFGKDIYYINVDDIIIWAEKIIRIVKDLYNVYPGIGDNKWREHASILIKENHVTPNDYIKLITKKKLIEL